jgi:hypothetical protein
MIIHLTDQQNLDSFLKIFQV